ncbi:MAG TPA: hypothetical protein VNR17_12990 [Luteimicrobium sp.]|nr:hypothetical protein [Luteimicrobium sp.]
MSIAEPPGTPDPSPAAEAPTVVTPDDRGGDPAPVVEEPRAGAPVGLVPALDVVRDVVAAVLLLTSLALPWTTRSGAADRVEVVLSVVVALAAIPVPYLARAGILPTGWSVHTTRTVRLWAAAPYVVVSLVYLLLDLFGGTSLGDRGVGTGLALGLAGALLVAQPRSTELGPDDEDAGAPRLWRLVLAVVGAALVVGAVAALVIFLASGPWSGAAQLLFAILGTLVVLAIGAVPAWGAYQGDRAWADVTVGVGAVLAVLFVVGAGAAPDLLRYESFHTLRFGLVLVPALGAVAAGAAFRRGLRPAAGTDGVARATLLLLTVVAALIALARVVVLTDGAHSTSVVVTLVATGAVAVLAAVAWFAYRSSTAGGRSLAWLAAVVAVVLGTVAVSVDAWKVVGVPVELAVVAYGLPVLLALALLGPVVREWGARTRVEAVGPRTSYEWTPRPRRAPRAAKAAVPAQQSAEPDVAPAESSAEPSAEAVGTPQAAAPWAGAAVGTAHEPEPARPVVVEPRAAEPEPELARAEPVREPAAVDAEPSGAAEAVVEEPAAAEPEPRLGATAPVEPSPAEPSPVEPERAAADQQSTTVLPVAGYTAAQAADPSTPLEVLAQIAEHAPALRPYVASNPSTYTALLDWLGALGDPAVDAALQARPDRRR